MSTSGRLDIQKSLSDVWEQLSCKVNKAVVFCDNVTAECLHWNGGAILLFQAGAQAIKDFSSFESGTSEQKKAVFVISGSLTETNEEILKDILEASHFQYVIVVSTHNAAFQTLLQYGVVEEEMKAFWALEDKLLEWMGNMNYTAEVLYMPLSVAPIHPQLFVLPRHNNLFSLLPSDIYTLQCDASDPRATLELELSHLTEELHLELKTLASSLSSLLDSLSICDDVYSMGCTSKIVAQELANLGWAKTRRKTARHKASVLLIDRCLDLGSVVGHHAETLLDKILAVLPQLPGHHIDVTVNMAPVCGISRNVNSSVVVPGCLAHASDPVATSLLTSLASMRHKETVMEINRQIVESATRENLPIKLSSRPRITADLLESHVALFKGKNRAIKQSSGVIQITLAAIETLKHPGLSKLDSLLGVEKGLLQCLGEDEGPSPLTQLTQTLNREVQKNPEDRLYSVEDIFLLLIFVFSLFDKDDMDNVQEERIFQSAVVKAIMEADPTSLPDFLKELVPTDRSEEDITVVLENLFQRLDDLRDARQNLKQFRSMHQGGGISPVSLKPLLKQLTEEIFNPAKPDLVDLEYKSTGFRDLLKSGFGLFKSVSKPRPSDHPTLIIFVIGGVSSTEVKQVKEAVAASKTECQVIVGSTGLVTPRHILQNVFSQDNLHPRST